MKGSIRIDFDQETGKVAIYGPMQNQNEKNLTIKVLVAAVGLVTDYQPSPLIKPTPNGAPIISPQQKPNGGPPKDIVS